MWVPAAETAGEAFILGRKVAGVRTRSASSTGYSTLKRYQHPRPCASKATFCLYIAWTLVSECVSCSMPKSPMWLTCGFHSGFDALSYTRLRIPCGSNAHVHVSDERKERKYVARKQCVHFIAGYNTHGHAHKGPARLQNTVYRLMCTFAYTDCGSGEPRDGVHCTAECANGCTHTNVIWSLPGTSSLRY